MISPNEFNPNLISGIVATIAGTIIILLRKTIEDVFTHCSDKIAKLMRDSFKRHYVYDKKAADKAHAIQELLIEMRVKTDASRSVVYQFHNGSEFTSRNPIWRISCTHESVRSGTSSEISSFQNILASGVLNLITNFWTDVPTPGIQTVKINADFGNIIVVKTIDMDPGYSQTILEDQGIFHSINASIKDRRNGIVGFVSLHFDDGLTDDELLEAVNIIKQYSLHISFILLGDR